MHTNLHAYRMRTCITMQGEENSHGVKLFAPLHCIDNALILEKNGYIVFLDTFSAKSVPPSVPVHDLGDATIIPPLVNAHTHIQLSHLHEKTHLGQGFVPWLTSLIPLLKQAIEPKCIQEAILQAMRTMHTTGTGHFADFTSYHISMVAQAATAMRIDTTLFAEWLGFDHTWQTEHPLPPACHDFYTKQHISVENTDIYSKCVPCGHALYSTAPDILQAVQHYCTAQHVPFAIHLAESVEETEALTTGTGALVDLYRRNILPADWTHAGLPPVPLAQHWGLLQPNTLAVHCVQCTKSDAHILAQHGVNVCLCPRSNELIHVGTAPIEMFIKAGIRLCLGTDGLCSNTDLNLWQEALFLREHKQLPNEALLRMLTVNGATALHLAHAGTLCVGAKARWTSLPSSW